MIYVTWTDPETGRRELRMFPTPDGTGKLHRWLKRKGIPYSTGSAISSAVATRPAEGRRWKPDPRVWRSLGRGDAA